MMQRHPHFFCLCLLIASGLVFCDSIHPTETAIASLEQVSGFVEVSSSKDQKNFTRKSGVLIHVNDKIQTQSNGRATLVFRDGSKIRIFESTELIISQSDELKTIVRSFESTLLMKKGAFWGKFIERRQKTQIQTNNARLEVIGTGIRVKEDGKQTSIAIVEGSVMVKNESSSIILKAGQLLHPFNKNDNLKEKLGEIPYRLSLIPEKYQLDFKKSQEIHIQIQMVDLVTDSNIKRAGGVYLQSNYYNIEFPNNVRLNHSGFAWIPVKIKSPYVGDNQFEGDIVIWAVMDGANYEQVGSGSLLLKLNLPRKRELIQVDANSGNIIPNK